MASANYRFLQARKVEENNFPFVPQLPFLFPTKLIPNYLHHLNHFLYHISAEALR